MLKLEGERAESFGLGLEGTFLMRGEYRSESRGGRLRWVGSRMIMVVQVMGISWFWELTKLGDTERYLF